MSFTVNLDLGSFEPQVAAVAGLAQLLVDHSPRFVFVSSVARGAASSREGKIPADRSLPLSDALGGYGRSKAVAEEILLNSSLPATVVRVGQLSGSSKTGRWEASNWVPAILQSSSKLGCLPDLDGKTAWTPIDIAGLILRDITFDSTRPVMHLENPNMTPWSDIFAEAARALAPPHSKPIKIVPYAEWYEALGAYKAAASSEEEAAKELPALRLFSFFASLLPNSNEKKHGERDASGARTLETSESAAECKRLANCHRIDGGDVRAWIAYWRSIGYLSS